MWWSCQVHACLNWAAYKIYDTKEPLPQNPPTPLGRLGQHFDQLQTHSKVELFKLRFRHASSLGRIIFKRLIILALLIISTTAMSLIKYSRLLINFPGLKTVSHRNSTTIIQQSESRHEIVLNRIGNYSRSLVAYLDAAKGLNETDRRRAVRWRRIVWRFLHGCHF